MTYGLSVKHIFTFVKLLLLFKIQNNFIVDNYINTTMNTHQKQLHCTVSHSLCVYVWFESVVVNRTLVRLLYSNVHWIYFCSIHTLLHTIIRIVRMNACILHIITTEANQIVYAALCWYVYTLAAIHILKERKYLSFSLEYDNFINM